MPDLSGGQKFSFPTLFDFCREVFLNKIKLLLLFVINNMFLFSDVQQSGGLVIFQWDVLGKKRNCSQPGLIWTDFEYRV